MQNTFSDHDNETGPASLRQNRVANVVVSLLFMLAIATPGLMLGWTWSRSVTGFENRRAEAWPVLAKWSAKSIRDYTAGFERAFNDRFGFRDSLIRANNLLLLAVFRKSPSSNVAVGRDNWLFYTSGGSYDWFIGRVSPPGQATITAIARGIERRVRLMKDLGIPYRIVIAPDKHSIHPEQLSLAHSMALSRYSQIDEVMKALDPSVRSSVLDLRAPLIAAKNQGLVYYATDSHWNARGAWIGYRTIMEAVGLKAEPYPAIAVERPFAGDLSRMIGAETIFNELDPLPGAFVDDNSPCQKPEHYSAAFKNYRCPSADNGGLVMHVDSFGFFVEPFLNPRFRTASYMVNSQVWDIPRLASNPPALVVDEIVERELVNLANTPAAFVADEGADTPTTDQITFACAVEAVQVQKAEGYPSRIVHVSGWAADLQKSQLPDKLWIHLEGAGGRFVSEADTHRQRPDVLRPDVAAFFKKPGIEGAAFSLRAAASEIPVGEYDVKVTARFADMPATCPSTSKVVVAP